MNELKLQFSFGDFEVKASMNEEEYKYIKEIGLEPIQLLISKISDVVYNDERFKDKGFTF